jgi:hypothetical protein
MDDETSGFNRGRQLVFAKIVVNDEAGSQVYSANSYLRIADPTTSFVERRTSTPTASPELVQRVVLLRKEVHRLLRVFCSDNRIDNDYDAIIANCPENAAPYTILDLDGDEIDSFWLLTASGEVRLHVSVEDELYDSILFAIQGRESNKPPSTYAKMLVSDERYVYDGNIWAKLPLEDILWRCQRLKLKPRPVDVAVGIADFVLDLLKHFAIQWGILMHYDFLRFCVVERMPFGELPLTFIDFTSGCVIQPLHLLRGRYSSASSSHRYVHLAFHGSVHTAILGILRLSYLCPVYHSLRRSYDDQEDSHRNRDATCNGY